MSGDIFGCHSGSSGVRMGYWWHLVGRGQGCCYASYNAKASSPQHWFFLAKTSIVPGLRNCHIIELNKSCVIPDLIMYYTAILQYSFLHQLYILKYEFTPWLVWLSGLSAGCESKCRWFHSQSGHMSGLQASPQWGPCERQPHIDVSFSLPSHL